MPGSSTTPGRSDLAMVRPKRVAFRARNSVGARGLAFAAPWLAYALPYRRFVGVLTDANARLGRHCQRTDAVVEESRGRRSRCHPAGHHHHAGGGVLKAPKPKPGLICTQRTRPSRRCNVRVRLSGIRPGDAGGK